jgi:hypothetical protein
MDAENLLKETLEAAQSLRRRLAALGNHYVKFGDARRAESLNAHAAKLDGMELHLACFMSANDGHGQSWRSVQKPR